MRNHSATHLLQSALRQVLGTHVEQSGSYVDDKRLRFDFSHFDAMSADEIARVEEMVNASILQGYEINISEMSMDDAKKEGATALFGEKYSDIVRVVNMGSYSVELCGGTHLDNTAKIGLFKIISENSVASGIRRIEAVTGYNVLGLIFEEQKLIDTVAGILKTNKNDLLVRSKQVMDEQKDLETFVKELNFKMALQRIDELIKSAEKVGGFTLITAHVGDVSVDVLKTMADDLKGRADDIVAVLAGESEGKLSFCAVCAKKAVEAGLKAGDLIKHVSSIADGSGGGRADSAFGAGKDLEKAGEALNSVKELILK